MDDTSHFDVIRIQNRRLIRNLMLDYKQISKSQLAGLSGLSFPTVSALINDLLESGEAIILDCTATRGGRPAGLYALAPLYRTAICAYLEEGEIVFRIVNAYGESIEEGSAALPKTGSHETLHLLIRDLQDKYPSLSAISLGIPGVVKDGRVLFLPTYPEFEGVDLGADLSSTFGIPAFLENDVNSMVLAERDVWPNLFHLFRGKCISGAGSGILINGELLHGVGGFAGEIAWIPFFEKEQESPGTNTITLSPEMSSASAQANIASISSVIIAVICILNPADIAISGFGIDFRDLDEIKKKILNSIPSDRFPELHLVDDTDSLYFSGLLGLVTDYWRDQ
jgi:DNA-binding Lrp family transcriptional regulator